MIEKIDRILELLSGYEHYDIMNQKINYLTAPGENYGSLMLAIELNLKNKKSSIEKVLKTVAKLMAPNEFIQKVFNSQVSFKSEINFYEIIVPTLQNFRKKCGLEEMGIFAHSYGSRINLNGSDVVDGNGILILENLKETGYTMLDRMIGFDLETAKLVVKELASFHATSLALKLTHPDVFKTKIVPHFNPFVLHEEEFQKMISAWANTLKENPETKELIPRILPRLEMGHSDYKPREPFVTLAHSDLWINNIMIKNVNGNPRHVKFVDFQFPQYKSPVADLIFLLFSSVSTQVLSEHFDYLLKYFYANFIEILTKLNREVPSLTWEFFLKEVRTEVEEAELFHIAFMTMVVFASKEVAKNVSEFNEANGITGRVSQFQKEKMWFFAKEFAKRNWI